MHKGRSEARRCSPESLQDSILLPFPLSFLLFVRLVLERGTLQVEPPTPGPRRSPSGSAGGAVAHGAGDPRVRRCESSPRSSLRPPETLEQPSNTGVSLDTRTRLSPRSPPMGTFEPPKLVHHFGYRWIFPESGVLNGFCHSLKGFRVWETEL